MLRTPGAEKYTHTLFPYSERDKLSPFTALLDLKDEGEAEGRARQAPPN